MDDNLAILLLMTMAIIAAVTVMAMSARTRARRAQIASEKQGGERLEQRIAVLERIATDPATRTAHEIEALRGPAN